MKRRARTLKRECWICGVVFRTSRSDARTCSDVCRRRLNRSLDGCGRTISEWRESLDALDDRDGFSGEGSGPNSA